jgi:hypothetical protein
MIYGMTMEQPPQIETAEIIEQQPSAFEQSMEQLLGVLDTTEQKRGMYFYKATWDEQNPALLTSVARVSAKATGALKEERFGEFHQAQLRVKEEYNGFIAERFIWCDAGLPLRPNERITLNLEALREQFGYEVCAGTNVAKDLIDHVESIDDCLTLTGSLQNRKGIFIGRELAQQVNRFTADFLYRDLGDESIDITEGSSKLFTLINQCEAFGQDVPKWVQGYLVSSLLQVISGQSSPRAKRLSADEAMTILESGIEQNVISRTGTLQRILGCPALYRYPYGTELLHKNLQATGAKGPVNIFGVDRVKFATSYIVMRLSADEAILPTPVRDYLNTVEPKNVKEKDYEELYKTMSELVCVVDGNEAAEQFFHPRAIGSMFEHVLVRLHGDKRDATQEDFDQKCVEIVEATLEPLSFNRLGARALLDEAELEE